MLKNNYHKPNTKKVRKFLIGLKSFCASLATVDAVQGNYKLATTILIIGFALSEAITFLSDGTNENTN